MTFRVFAFVNLNCSAKEAYGVNPAKGHHKTGEAGTCSIKSSLEVDQLQAEGLIHASPGQRPGFHRLCPRVAG